MDAPGLGSGGVAARLKRRASVRCSITVDLANLKSHHISKQLRQPKAGPVLCKYKEPHNMIMAIKIPSRSLALELDKCGLFSSSSFITRIKTCLRTCLR